jgi:hypothetical protein
MPARSQKARVYYRTFGTPGRYKFLNFNNIAIRREDFGQLEYYSRRCPERKMPTMRLLRYPNTESYIVLSWTASLDLFSPRAEGVRRHV